METLKFCMKHAKKYMFRLFLLQLVSFSILTIDLLIPILSGMLLNYIIKGEAVKPGDGGIFSFILSGEYGEVQTFELFFNIAALFLGLIALRLILLYVRDCNRERVGIKLENDLRHLTFKKLLELDSKTVSEYNSGELLQIMASDVLMFKSLVSIVIPNMIDSVFVLVFATYMLSTINAYFIYVPVCLLPFLIYSLISFRKKIRESWRNIRDSHSEMNLTVKENIEALRIVRSFTNEELEKEKFNRSNQTVKKNHFYQIDLSAKFGVVLGTIRQIAYISTIAIGAVLVINGHMLVGYIATCSTYVIMIMDHITNINNYIFQMQQQIVSGAKMKHFVERGTKIPDKENSTLTIENPHLKLTNVSMELDGKKVLKNIDLDIPYGKKVGIVGGTGAGKSVLLKSFVRIHDFNTGSFTINDVSAKEYSLKTLRGIYSYVFQDVFLFSNTIESNIAYGDPEIDDEFVFKAAKDAQAHDFITALSDGYQTIVGERGLGISGGQKQRVSIARALLKNAPILIFDDSTSALDVNTERKLLETINKEYSDKTVIITAHRMTSVVDCDEIIYMKEGVITERGTFQELMALGGDFAEVYNVQQAQRAAVADFSNAKGGEN